MNEALVRRISAEDVHVCITACHYNGRVGEERGSREDERGARGENSGGVKLGRWYGSTRAYKKGINPRVKCGCVACNGIDGCGAHSGGRLDGSDEAV